MIPSPSTPVAVVAGLVVLGCLDGVAELRLANRVLRPRPDAVFETPDGGPVELRGTARLAAGVLRSPVTETPCLAYEYEVEEERQSRNGRTWTTVSSGTQYAPFRLEDDTGSVLVEPPGADFRLTSEVLALLCGGVVVGLVVAFA